MADSNEALSLPTALHMLEVATREVRYHGSVLAAATGGLDSFVGALEECEVDGQLDVVIGEESRPHLGAWTYRVAMGAQSLAKSLEALQHAAAAVNAMCGPTPPVEEQN